MYKYESIKKFVDSNIGQSKEKYIIDYNLLCRISQMYHELEELKKCYCNRTDCSGRIKGSKTYDSLEQKIKNQQKEFIEYLENMLDNENDIFSAVRVKDVLSKYKEITGE